MTMEILYLQQGTPAWHQHRATSFNASDAPAVLACSPYKSRAALVRERATGITPEVDAATARRFADGHWFENLARPLAEKVIGEDLSPCVGKAGRYSASFDGITFTGDVAWEHKSLNQRLRDAMHDGCTGADLPRDYRAQMEHQAMVSGCERILFTASQWDREGGLIEARHCWYTPDPELRAQLVAGWEQFEADVAAYVPADAAAPVVAAPAESLPAVVVQVDGVLAVRGNLPAFGDALRAFIARIPTKPATDQEFADAEFACKRLKGAEDELQVAEEHVISLIPEVRAIRDHRSLARATRLAIEKPVAAEKDARRERIVRQAQADLAEHLDQLNAQLQAHGAGQIVAPAPAVFAACIKGLKSLDSMQDKLTAELVTQRVHFDALAQRMLANRAALRRDGGDWISLFADFAVAGAKEPEDFAALAELRITRFRQDEAARQAAETATRQLVAAQAESAQKPAQALASQAPAAIKTEACDSATVTLGHINSRLAPISLSAAGLAELGYEPVATVKAAKLYRECDYPAICRAISEHALAAVELPEAMA
ncbi:YqaJ viral recombinase family protein [Pulveribacter sp.]|uniref:YqaJ viral recombinase family protein n=1 Tax=Pulveribacter sp. TaxID=2678893 RepID=UPI00289D56F0|nr:YqaJ viral recombinase family protein [Pulveribacter sp.]